MSRVRSFAARCVPILVTALVALCAGPASAGKNVGSINFTLGNKSLTSALSSIVVDGDTIAVSPWYLSAPRVGAAGDTLDPGRPTQPALGFELTWGHEGWPAMVALDVLHSYDDGIQQFPDISLGALVIPPATVRRRARTIEIGFGVRRAFTVLGYTPYVGGGGSWVRASVDYDMSDPSQGHFGAPGESIHARDAAFGYWAGGGIYRRLGPRLQLGLTGRYSKATITLPGLRVVGENGGYRFAQGTSTEVDAGGKHFGLVVGWSFPSR